MRALCWLLALAAIGCGYRERGRFAAAAVGVPPFAQALSSSPVVGRACFGAGAELGDDRVIEAAARDALKGVPGADGLANASIVDEGECIRVEGTAVRTGRP